MNSLYIRLYRVALLSLLDNSLGSCAPPANPVSVYCQQYNPPGSWCAGNASAICIYEMSDGSVFSYTGSWCAEGVQTSWDGSCRIIDEKGTEPPEPGQAYDHQGCLNEMFNALEQGRQAETSCRDNMLSMSMVFGAIESAKTGSKIIIGLVTKKVLRRQICLLYTFFVRLLE